MKKIVLILFAASSLYCAENSQQDDPTQFTYIAIGGDGFGLMFPLLPEVAIGCRRLQSHHVWDWNAGVTITEVVYAQVSYLYFLKPSKGFYFGAGLTGLYRFGDDWVPRPLRSLLRKTFVNFPVTLGYQFVVDQRYRFVQLQFTPFLTTTFSFGIGF